MGSGKPAEQVSTLGMESHTGGSGRVTCTGESAWQLLIPPGSPHQYRLAQLDDYHNKPRSAFPWRPPVTLSLCARVSSANIAGTWGFGFWNDPFSLSLGLGGGERRLPALPNAAWFFYASSENHLSLCDDLPANGLLAATFRSPRIPSVFLGFTLPFLPLFLIPAFSRLVRRFSRTLIQQDAMQLKTDITSWQEYTLCWLNKRVDFYLNGNQIFSTTIVPHAPLGFVLWVDNQFASWNSEGKIAFGNLTTSQQTILEVEEFSIQGGRSTDFGFCKNHSPHKK